LTTCWIVATLLVTAACRPAVHTPRPDQTAGGDRAAVVLGASLYAAYCGGCHGPKGEGNGPVADVIDIYPANLRTSRVVATATDEQLLDRVMHGTPIRSTPRPNAIAEDLKTDAIVGYLRTLSGAGWERLRVGRLAYERTCAVCHGAYGDGIGVFGANNDPPPPNLMVARERYSDAALSALVEDGHGTMPPLAQAFQPADVRAVVAYVRHLSKGYRLYDTYCASCHGDDGSGVQPEDLVEPSVVAPPIGVGTVAGLGSKATRAKVLHMLRRESGTMPHFRQTLTKAELLNVIAYLRTGFR
jgi:mono/diheme cytochrome c family protein